MDDRYAFIPSWFCWPAGTLGREGIIQLDHCYNRASFPVCSNVMCSNWEIAFHLLRIYCVIEELSRAYNLTPKEEWLLLVT